MLSHTLRHMTSEISSGEQRGKLYQHRKPLNADMQSAIVSGAAVWFPAYHSVIKSYCVFTHLSFSIALWSSSSAEDDGCKARQGRAHARQRRAERVSTSERARARGAARGAAPSRYKEQIQHSRIAVRAPPRSTNAPA